MARYRKIDPRIWNDEKFSSLSHEAQRMFFFCLTHPSMTALGAFRITKSGMAEELGLSGKGFAEPFRELFRKGLVKYDERAFLLFIPNFLKYNVPENPNVVRGWTSSLDLLPECPLKTEVLLRAKACTADNDALSKAFDKSFGRVTETLSEGFPKPLAKGMPKQEQEQEYIYSPASQHSSLLDAETQDIAVDEKESQAEVPYDKIVEIYNETCKQKFPQVARLTDKRKKAVKSFGKFFKDYTKAETIHDFLAEVEKYFALACRSDFLCGSNDRGWKADFDFLMNVNKAVSILEGKYGCQQKADSGFKVTPVHDWRAEMKAEREKDNLLDHAEAINAYFRGVS